ncbi:UNVERIFIED_CONTAM: hypothetical protein Sradi_2385700 [Sesamum radiatum]|uniref:Uncharacterized protein n=1 Tax=Sesamum radiatum TaxID=300843 RepID=A0AAW2T6R9_SESRA
MEGDKLIPDWNISDRSSVLLHNVGQDSQELYNVCYLRGDQATLLMTPHTRLEEHHVHILISRRSQILADHKVRELHRMLIDSASGVTEIESQRSALETKVQDLQNQLAESASEIAKAKKEAFNEGRAERFDDGQAASKLKGVAEGRED